MTMPQDMFFENFSPPSSQEGLGDDLNTAVSVTVEDSSSSGFLIFNSDLVESLRQGQVAGINELEAAIGLAELAQDQLRKYATDSSHSLDDRQMAIVLRALKAVLRRLGADNLQLPFRDYESFRTDWISKGLTGEGSWQQRRNYLESLFMGARMSLEDLENNRLTKPLTNPVRGNDLSWPEVDLEIRELRRKFDSAVTPQDYRALGTNCVGVLEAVGEAVYDSSLDLRGDELTLPRDRSKERIERFVERSLSDEDETVRKLVRASARLAHKLKHSQTPSPLMAGICADNVILVASLLRRVADPSFERLLDDEAPF